jgi:hypothetical protein
VVTAGEHDLDLPIVGHSYIDDAPGGHLDDLAHGLEVAPYLLRRCHPISPPSLQQTGSALENGYGPPSSPTASVVFFYTLQRPGSPGRDRNKRGIRVFDSAYGMKTAISISAAPISSSVIPTGIDSFNIELTAEL